MTRATEWASRVAAWRTSGLSASAYCEGREYSSKSLQWWASKLRRQGGPGQRLPNGAEPLRLARVVRVASDPVPMTGKVVVHVGAARVEVSSGSDRATLAAVFQALGLGAAGAAP